MSGLTPLLRQWTILRSLSARRRGCSVREMADEAGVSEKTIRRDLNQLRSAGFPLEETTVERGRKLWRVAENGLQPPLSFTLDEALALYLGRRFLEPLAGTDFSILHQWGRGLSTAEFGRGVLPRQKQFSTFNGAGVYDLRKRWVAKLSR